MRVRLQARHALQTLHQVFVVSLCTVWKPCARPSFLRHFPATAARQPTHPGHMLKLWSLHCGDRPHRSFRPAAACSWSSPFLSSLADVQLRWTGSVISRVMFLRRGESVGMLPALHQPQQGCLQMPGPKLCCGSGAFRIPEEEPLHLPPIQQAACPNLGSC